MVLPPGAASPRVVAKRYLGGAIGLAGDRLVLDELDLVRSVALQSDIYVVDPRTGRRHRVTREARAGDPDYDVARRIGVPYPTLLVLGGLGLAVVPGLPRIHLEPELVLLVFLPPLLFGAAVDTPSRELRANLAPLLRLSVGLVVFTMAIVAVVANAVVPGLGWAAAFALGAIVAPTDALAATSVFRRMGAPRVVVTLVEGEALFNDATALVAYRAAVVAAIAGTFVLADALGTFLVAALGGIVLGYLVGRLAGVLLRWLDNPPVEVAISIVVPFAAYLPAEQVGISGVLAAVTAGLVIGRRLGRILTPNSRILWLTSWKMIGFVLNGFAFVLIGMALPEVMGEVGGRSVAEVIGLGLLDQRRGHHRAHRLGLRLEPAARVASARRGPRPTRAWRGGSRSSSAGPASGARSRSRPRWPCRRASRSGTSSCSWCSSSSWSPSSARA